MSYSSQAKNWSDKLNDQTREIIKFRDPLSTRNGQLHLKHITSGFATMTKADLTQATLTLTNKQTKEQTTYPTVDALIEAGWAID